MELLIKGTRIVDESQDFLGDLYIKDGKIKDFGKDLDYKCDVFSGEGLILMPAFIDLHAHFRDPGYTHKEDLFTGSLAALKGGYTFVNLMGNTNPICSSMDVVNYVLDKSKDLNLIDVHQCVSVTKDFDGKTLDHLDTLDNRIKIITDDGKGINTNIVMYNAMVKAKEKGLILMVHSEDEDLTPIDYRVSENIITIRDIYLSKVTQCWLHLTHVSTKESIKAIRAAKENGHKHLTCDVTPHHIALWDSNYKVNPPIREREDVEVIIDAIADGTVDAIGTDHAPHTKEDKEKGSPGLVGLETSFSICYTSLVKAGHIDLKKLSKVMSANPADILKINKGRIRIGCDADLVLVDIDKKIVVDSNEFESKGRNTPFDGREFYGEVQHTIKGGEIKY
ncbi:dihydroorotase [Tissierella sp. Yu-01]|uniref:dihydroorotase n=1 Tax=Tissierella sp. Yu-01 TaxID=3035694 RepID=UPI00240DA3FE|nr:dihydroorotase [Tissierella sp. Yu-01]WFA08147.1 dihydroorotase [Tissierella sp. Yu-01]